MLAHELLLDLPVSAMTSWLPPLLTTPQLLAPQHGRVLQRPVCQFSLHNELAHQLPQLGVGRALQALHRGLGQDLHAKARDTEPQLPA